MTPSIEVQHVSKRYRKGVAGYRTLREDLYSLTGRLVHLRRHRPEDTDSRHIWALKNVDFRIDQGERVGIVGRNGSGKTTLLRLLAGVTQPTEGRIAVAGRLGVLIEIMAGFHPELTGRENIYLNGSIMGMSQKEIRRKFDEIVAFAELEGFIDTPIKHYSSGMHVRLGFSVAAHLDPDILLVDEVLAVGDAAFQAKCLGKMQGAARQGRTVVFVSHNMAAIQSLCDKSMLLRAGSLVEFGPTDDVIRSYLSFQDSLATIALSERTDRTGDGRIRFTQVHLYDADGRETPAARSGEPLRIGIDFVGDAAAAATSDWTVGMTVNDRLRENLLMFSTELTGTSLGAIPDRGQLVCAVPRFPLAAGTYYINLFSQVKGHVADWVIDGAALRVDAADFFGSGRLPPETHTKLLVEHHWSLK